MSTVVLRRWCRAHIGIAAVLATSATITACQGRPSPLSVHELAEGYVRLALQFAQHRPSLVERWHGPSEWNPGPRVPVETLRQTAEELLARADHGIPSNLDVTEAARVAYLRGQLRALLFIGRRLLGESPPFGEEVRETLGAPLPNVDVNAVGAARAALDRALPGEGDLAKRLLAYRQSLLIPEAAFDRVAAMALGICRARSPIDLPPSERVRIAFDAAQDWPAFARYEGSHLTVVTFASRQGHDPATLLHTVCHESVPGHHAQHVWIDDALVLGHGWREYQLAPAFGPHLLITEGAAEAATEMALDQDDGVEPLASLLAASGIKTSDARRVAAIHRLALQLEALVPSLVARYLDNQASRDATIDALARETLMADPQRFVAFVEQHRVQAIVYPVARAVVSTYLTRQHAGDRWRGLRELFTLKPFSVAGTM